MLPCCSSKNNQVQERAPVPPSSEPVKEQAQKVAEVIKARTLSVESLQFHPNVPADQHSKPVFLLVPKNHLVWIPATDGQPNLPIQHRWTQEEARKSGMRVKDGTLVCVTEERLLQLNRDHDSTLGRYIFILSQAAPLTVKE